MKKAAPALNGNVDTMIGNVKAMVVLRNLNVTKERWKIFDARRQSIFMKNRYSPDSEIIFAIIFFVQTKMESQRCFLLMVNAPAVQLIRWIFAKIIIFLGKFSIIMSSVWKSPETRTSNQFIILPYMEFGLNDHREDALHFITTSVWDSAE